MPNWYSRVAWLRLISYFHSISVRFCSLLSLRHQHVSQFSSGLKTAGQSMNRGQAGSSIRSVVENIPGIVKLMPEQEVFVNTLNGGDVEALLTTGFGKSLIYKLLPIVSETLGRPKASKGIVVIESSLVAWRIRLRRQ